MASESTRSGFGAAAIDALMVAEAGLLVEEEMEIEPEAAVEGENQAGRFVIVRGGVALGGALAGFGRLRLRTACGAEKEREQGDGMRGASAGMLRGAGHAFSWRARRRGRARDGIWWRAWALRNLITRSCFELVRGLGRGRLSLLRRRRLRPRVRRRCELRFGR